MNGTRWRLTVFWQHVHWSKSWASGYWSVSFIGGTQQNSGPTPAMDTDISRVPRSRTRWLAAGRPLVFRLCWTKSLCYPRPLCRRRFIVSRQITRIFDCFWWTSFNETESGRSAHLTLLSVQISFISDDLLIFKTNFLSWIISCNSFKVKVDES